MARAMAVFTVALALFAATGAAREAPFGEQKTYAPPYGTPTDPAPVYSPPTGVSPVTPTPDVPYTPVPTDPVPTPYTPTDPVPTTPAPASPGTCQWWSSNTGSFPDIISILSTIVDLFGSLSGGSSGGGGGITDIISGIFGGQMTVYQGLTNTRTDGFGALARQGSAALLNSMTRRDYTFSPLQVKNQFRNSLGSQQQAFQTARMFENANLALGARRH